MQTQNETGSIAEGKRYAIWLLPDDSAAARFADLIDHLSERYGGPRFSPHVTLLGRVTGPEDVLAETTQRLAEQLRALTLRPQGLAGEAYYFRCFYVKLEKSEQLSQAHEHASSSFNSTYATEYMPHLSLVYGHLPRTEKTKLRSEIEGKSPSDFIADRLQLIHIAVSVPDWRVVTTCSLKGS
ncbi:MAG: 2'-5' RNA ligase family protein [Acidiferrobacterales bacterium]